MASVFLSYDHDDAALAKPLIQALEKAGHTVWFDRHIHAGAQFSRKIEQALDEADAVIVLWTPCSLESAWVRDEAAEGRDRGKLIPLSIAGVTPPIGFRQFQTIDLGRWSGRGRMPRLDELLEAIDSQAPESAKRAAVTGPTEHEPGERRPAWIAAAVAAVLLVVATGAWLIVGHSTLPVVEVAPADTSSPSTAAANDLFVKLGSLAQIAKGKWQLVDSAAAPRNPAFIFRVADTGPPGQADPSIVLLDGRDNSLLWSREFSLSDATQADPRQQMSLTAGRVLGCALEARANGGLRRDLFKIFLDGCAQMAEQSQNNPEMAAAAMRTVVTGQRSFAPGWAHLLYAGVGVLGVAQESSEQPTAERQLRQDIDQASKVAPGLPEITVAETYLLPRTAFAQSLALLAKAKAQAPDEPEIYAEEASALQRVGRINDAIASARRAAELDPLSPTAETQFILALAHGGQIANAQRELERAEKVWAGTGALRDAVFGFHLRYGDPKVAEQLADDPGISLYLRAREDPSPANIEALKHWIKQFEARRDLAVAGLAVQALGQFHQTDDVFRWLAMIPVPIAAGAADVLFRPSLVEVRRDPRFMTVAKRIGLVDYWQSSGNWPDFCSDPELKYDCKVEARKLT